MAAFEVTTEATRIFLNLSRSQQIRIMILICCFGISFQLRVTAQETTSPSTAEAEVSALRSAAVASLKAYVANDGKALSELSPKYAAELKASLRDATRDLPKGSHLVLEDPSISSMVVKESRASLRLTVSCEWIDWENNKPLRTPFSFNVSFIKEQRRWLIVRVGSASKDLVNEYLEVKSIAEAKTLLEKESPLLNSAEALNVLEQTGGPTEERSVDRINRLVKWISEKSTYSTARANGLVRQGVLLIRNQDYEEAVEKLQQGLSAWEGLDDRIQVAGTLARLNEVHTYLKDGKGRAYLARAEALYLQEPQFQTGVLWAERLYGNALFNTRQYKEALEIYEGALKKSQDWGDRGMESVFLKDIGDCQFALEDYNAARRNYLACQNLTKPKSDGAPDAWDILLSLARVSLKQLKNRNALRLMYEARRDARISKSVPGLIAAYTAIANFHLSHHRGTTVIHIYEELLPELARTADPQVLANQLRDLYTSLTFDSGEVDVAKTIMTRALGRYRNLFTTDDYAQLLIARAGLDLMKGNVREIQRLSNEIQALPNLFEETKLFGLFLSILPPLMREQPEEVLHVLDQIQTAIRNLDIPEAPEIYALISWFRALTLFASEERAGHYDKSRVYLQKLCKSEEPLEQVIGNLYLGLLYLSLADEEGKDQEQYKNLGRSHLQKSIAILDTKTETSSMFLMLAWLYKAIVHHEEQEYEEALAAIKETFALASASGMPAMFGSLKVLEADAYQGLKQMKLATEALSEGIELIEADSENVAGGAAGRIKYFEQRNVLYKKQVKLLLDQERVGIRKGFCVNDRCCFLSHCFKS